jgi:hypothetical protein
VSYEVGFKIRLFYIQVCGVFTDIFNFSLSLHRELFLFMEHEGFMV